MAAVTYQYRSKKEVGNLSIRLTNGTAKNGIDLKMSTPIKSKRKYWYNTSKRAINFLKSLPKEATAKNHKTNLIELKHFIENQFLEDYNNGISITKDWLKAIIESNNIFDIKDTKEKISKEVEGKERIIKCNLLSNAILSMIDYYSINVNEQKKYKSALSLLKKYQLSTKTVYNTNDLNSKFSSKFMGWCLNEMLYKKSYINKVLMRYRKSVNYVYLNDEEDIIKVSKQLNNFKIFELRKNEKIVVTLNYDELKRIEKLKLIDENLKNARSALLLGCETGLRYSDMNKLNNSNLKTIQGLEFWAFNTSKTGLKVKIIASERLKHLIEVYGLPNLNKKNDDIKLNRLFKQLGKLAKIDEPTEGEVQKVVNIKGKDVKRIVKDIYPKYQLITTRTLRRSFATNYYGKIDTQLIMEVTGHTTEKMLKEYINKDDDTNMIKLKNQIDKFHQQRNSVERNN